MRGISRFGALVAVLLLAACDDPAGPGDGGGPTGRRSNPNTQATGDVPAVRRVGLKIDARGAFRPGLPIVVTANALGRYAASDVDMELVVLDDEDAAGLPGSVAARTVGRVRGALARNSNRPLVETITFAQPGYYRVVVQTRSTPPATGEIMTVGDSAIIEGSEETLYILVDDRGGRLTNGFDPAVVTGGRTPRFGSFGPFVASRAPGRAPAAVVVRPALTAAGNVQRGVFQYYNNDARAYRPIPNADLRYTCLNADYSTGGSFTGVTAADGSFSITCPAGLFDASISLRNQYAEVVSPGRVNAGVDYFNESVGATPVLNANNSYAAHVHVLLNRYIPVANQRFGVSRARIPVIVNATDSTFAINYNQVQDTIRQNYTRVFTEDGRFVTVHEYGHAFHWKALEPPYDYYCNPSGQHIINMQYTPSCAFVEGWATFFGVWVAGDSLTNTYYSDNTIENQTHYTGKDGSQVEGAVAGFLYDLVDGTTSPDGPRNETGADDTNDLATYPGSFLASTIRNCTFVNNGTTYTDMAAADELVYCLENNVTAEAEAARLGYTWAHYASVTRNVTAPSGFTTDAVRRLWKKNFYGQ